MDNLFFSLNATLPILFLIVLGFMLRKTGAVSPQLASGMNSFAFKISIPALLFVDLAVIDFRQAWDAWFVAFCFVATLACIGVALLLSLTCAPRTQRGEFMQASYRSSAALLGIAFITNIYGSTSMASLMIIGSVPLYNVAAVVVLECLRPDAKVQVKGSMAQLVKRAMHGIGTNPILLSIVAGVAWSLLGLPLPTFAAKTLDMLGATAAPLGLVAMGALTGVSDVRQSLKPAAVASFMKLVGFGLLIIPFAVALGFQAEKLVAILVMAGSATTVAAFTMACNMGHQGALTSTVVMLTTLLSPITLAAWLFALKSMALI